MKHGKRNTVGVPLKHHKYTDFGSFGEQFALHRLSLMGYRVTNVSTTTNHDIELESRHRIEVKAAMLSESGRPGRLWWQFSFRRRGLLIDEDLLILLCYFDIDKDPVAFVIPGDGVNPLLKKITIPSNDPRDYRGKWSVYIERWDLIEKVVGRSPRSRIVLEKEKVPF